MSTVISLPAGGLSQPCFRCTVGAMNTTTQLHQAATSIRPHDDRPWVVQQTENSNFCLGTVVCAEIHRRKKTKNLPFIGDLLSSLKNTENFDEAITVLTKEQHLGSSVACKGYERNQTGHGIEESDLVTHLQNEASLIVEVLDNCRPHAILVAGLHDGSVEILDPNYREHGGPCTLLLPTYRVAELTRCCSRYLLITINDGAASKGE